MKQEEFRFQYTLTYRDVEDMRHSEQVRQWQLGIIPVVIWYNMQNCTFTIQEDKR